MGGRVAITAAAFALSPAHHARCMTMTQGSSDGVRTNPLAQNTMGGADVANGPVRHAAVHTQPLSL